MFELVAFGTKKGFLELELGWKPVVAQQYFECIPVSPVWLLAS
jgi:hypothetical protein